MLITTDNSPSPALFIAFKIILIELVSLSVTPKIIKSKILIVIKLTNKNIFLCKLIDLYNSL